MNPIELVRARLAVINASIRAINDKATAEKRAELSAEETTQYAELRTQRDAAEARLKDLEDEEARAKKAGEGQRKHGVPLGPDGQPRAHITSEPQVYGKGSGNSYFLDVARFQLRHGNMEEAQERLNRHSAELDVELPIREEARARRAEEQLDGIAARDSREKRGFDQRGFFERKGVMGGAEKRVQPSRVDGNGGYFVPPLWLVDQFVPFLRNGRPFMNLVRQLDLPSGTDSINLPKLTTGTKTGPQGDNQPVVSQDIADSFINAPVRTIAGQEDLPIQLLDQSPVSFDEIIMEDLAADYALQVDTQGWIGPGINNQLKGIDFVSGVNAITYTTGSPTVQGLYPIVAQALSQVQRNRKRKDGILLFAQGPRWWWIASALDSQNRPLVPPGNAFNAMSQISDSDGPDGSLLARPLIVDLNITQVDGVGANQDRLYALRAQDLYLWEGAIRTRMLQEVLSGTLQIRMQLWNYVAFMPDRFPSAISIASGTGFTAPAGF